MSTITTEDYIRLADAAIEATEYDKWPDTTFLASTALNLSKPEVKTREAGSLPEDDIHSEPNATIEWHPLIPFLPKNTKILFLGSFPPPQKRWCINFFYPNFINDHWRIEGLVFHDTASYFVEERSKCFQLKDIVEHAKTHGIGFFDTGLAIRRLAGNASDKFLEITKATDIEALARHLPQLKAIVTTGEKSSTTLASSLGMRDDKDCPLYPVMNGAIPCPSLDIDIYRLPSSSRAYPMSLAKKAQSYDAMFRRYLDP